MGAYPREGRDPSLMDKRNKAAHEGEPAPAALGIRALSDGPLKDDCIWLYCFLTMTSGLPPV